MGVNIHELNEAESAVTRYILDNMRPTDGREHVQFLQIGANRSQIAGDPIHHLIQAGRWKGLLVEPLPQVFAQLKEALAGSSGLSFANVAISDTPGALTLYYPEGRTELASFNADTVKAHFPQPGEVKLQTADVPAVRFEDLLKEHGGAGADALIIDTEGMDARIIQSIDFEHFRPRVVHYEIKHLDDASLVAAHQHLEAAGYMAFAMGANAMAVLPSEDEAGLITLLKTIFRSFRAMERRSMAILLRLNELAQVAMQNTPRS